MIQTFRAWIPRGRPYDLSTGSDLHDDTAYINHEMKELILDFEGVSLKAATKGNTLIRNMWAPELENQYYRKRIENTFADVKAKIHAVTAKSFLIKLLYFIIMFILDQQF